jgi:hypothetical protein
MDVATTAFETMCAGTVWCKASSKLVTMVIQIAVVAAMGIARGPGSCLFVEMEFIATNLNTVTMVTLMIVVAVMLNVPVRVMSPPAGMAIIAPNLKLAMMAI